MVACTSLQDIGVVGAMRSELVRFGAAKAADDLARTIERCGGDKMGCLRALQVAQTYPQARHFNLLAYDPARKRFQPV
jgi:hypothetical protein